MSTSSAVSLSPADLARYSRHLALREIGVQGQEKLKAAKVLLVGAGGLGSPAALYLAASGVGTIGVIDNDRVDVSNLQRQVLYDTQSVGRPKAEAAKGASTGAEEEKKDGGCSVARGQAAPWALVAMGMVVALLTRRRR